MKKFTILPKSSFLPLATVLLSLLTSQVRAQQSQPAASEFLLATAGPASSQQLPRAGTGQLAPDLQLAAAPQLPPTPLPAGGSAVVKATVRNAGTRRAGFSVLGYYLSADAALSSDDVLLGDAMTTALAPGSALEMSTTLTVPAGTAAGSYYLLCVADYLHLVREGNHGNNSWARPLEVAPPAATAPAARRTAALAAPASRAESLAGFELSIAPNPVAAATPLRVQLSAAEPQPGSELALFNGLGQQVGSQALGPGRFSQAELPTAGLAAGVYVLRLTGPGLRATRRVVIR